MSNNESAPMTDAAGQQTSNQNERKLPKGFWPWMGTLALSLLAFVVCQAAGLDLKSSCFLGLTVLAIGLWGFSLLNDGLVAVMLPISYILFGVGTPAQMLSSWTQPMGWLILGGLMTGVAMQDTGLANRIAIWSLHVTGGSFKRIIWGLFLAGFIITPMMPTIIGKCIILAIICIGICDAMGFKPQSKEASTLLMAGYLAVECPRLCYLTGGGEITLNMQMLANAGTTVSYLEYFIQNFLPYTLYSVLSILLLLIVMKPRTNKDARQWVETKYKDLGPMTTKEKKALFLFILLIALMMTDKWHGINVAWLMMVIGFVGFLPGFNLVDGKKFKAINFTPIFFVLGCMSIGAAAQSTGMAKTISQLLLPLLDREGELGTGVAAFAAGLGVNFLLTPVAAISTLTIPLAETAKTLGLNPIAIVNSFMLGLDQYVLPYEYAPFLYMFSLGFIKMKDMVVVFGLRAILALILLVCVFYPFWMLVGAA